MNILVKIIVIIIESIFILGCFFGDLRFRNVQEQDISSFSNLYGDYTRINATELGVNLDKYLQSDSITVIYRLVKLWDEYEQKCYSDSSKVIFGYFRDLYTDKEFKTIYIPKAGQVQINLLRTEKGYIHKQPSLEGFMKFIKQKLKK